MRPRLLAITLVVLVLTAGCLGTGTAPQVPSTGTEGTVLPEVTYEAVSFETDLGTFTAILYPEDAPETVAFMKDLVSSGYYDGREFGRVIPGFVIQEVDRAGGVTDQQRTVPLEAGKRSQFSAGALGIARNEDPNSGGSEFFVMDFATSHLYGNYTVWGQVVEGLDVVHAIARVQAIQYPQAPVPGAPAIPWPTDRAPVAPPKILKATLLDVTIPGLHASFLPWQVAPTIRTPEFRYTLEYPYRFDDDGLSPLTWYVWARGEEPAPAVDEVRVRVRGASMEQEIRFLTDANAHEPSGVYHWYWQPPAPGIYNVTLLQGSTELAWADIPVGEARP